MTGAPSTAPPFYRTSSRPTRLARLVVGSLPLSRTAKTQLSPRITLPVGCALVHTHFPTQPQQNRKKEEKKSKPSELVRRDLFILFTHRNCASEEQKKKSGAGVCWSMLRITCVSDAQRRLCNNASNLVDPPPPPKGP